MLRHRPQSERLRLDDVLRPGVAAVRQNWRPFVLIQFIAAAVVAGYFLVPAVTRVLDTLGLWRATGGPLFVIGSAIVAGVVLPEIAKALTLGWRANREKALDLLFLSGVFSCNGLLVDGFYRLLGHAVGGGNDAGTIATKVLIDLAIFSPLLAQPLVVLLFDWRRHRFRPSPTLRQISLHWYLRRVLPLQVPAWVFWGPVVVLIYALPVTLQFILWLFVFAAWSLVVVFIGTDHPTPPTTAPTTLTPEPRPGDVPPPE